MDNLEKRISRYKNNINLPLINTSSSKKIILKANSQNHLIHSSIKVQKYRLDFKKYQTNISTKKKKLDFLKRECQQLKKRDNSTEKLINISLKLDSKELPQNNQDELIFLENENEKVDKVKNYKEKKSNLETTRKEYNRRNEENNRIKYEINEINSDIKDIEYKIDWKINDVKNIKNKIENSKKNIREIKQIIKDNKERNIKLIHMHELEKQRFANITKLNEANKIIKNNDDEIIELKRKLDELSNKKNK
jgi:chromosome segregation ATPase